jgi:hypothetical protein
MTCVVHVHAGYKEIIVNDIGFVRNRDDSRNSREVFKEPSQVDSEAPQVRVTSSRFILTKNHLSVKDLEIHFVWGCSCSDGREIAEIYDGEVPTGYGTGVAIAGERKEIVGVSTLKIFRGAERDTEIEPISSLFIALMS